MCDPWAELDNIIRHHGDYTGVENEKNSILAWKMRAETAEREVQVWQGRMKDLVEAVKEERQLREESFNELTRVKNALEERCSLLEVKMLKLIETSKNEQASEWAHKSAELTLEMENKLKEANGESERLRFELAQSQERVSSLENKIRQLVEIIKTERESSKKSGEDKIELELLHSRLAEAAQREQALQAEVSRLSEVNRGAQMANSTNQAELRVKELEDKLKKVGVAVMKDREKKSREILELMNANEDLTKRLQIHQEKLRDLEKELGRCGPTDSDSMEELQRLRKRVEGAESRAHDAEKLAEQRINDFKVKIKQLFAQQEAKYKQQLASTNSSSRPLVPLTAEQRLQELEQRCQMLERQNQDFEAKLTGPIEMSKELTHISFE